MSRATPERVARACLILSALVTLSACGSGSSESGDGGNGMPVDGANTVATPPASVPSDVTTPRFVALVELFEDRFESEVFAFAEAEFRVVSAETGRGFLALADDEGCVVPSVVADGDGSLTDEDGDRPDAGDGGSLLVSAGETVLLSGAAGTLVTLVRDLDGSPFYIPETELAGPWPADVTLDVPGDIFPAGSGVRMPTAPPPVGRGAGLSSPRPGETVTADTVFRWTATGVPSLRFAFEVLSPDGPFEVYCVVDDDGEYAFSPEERARLGDGFAMTADELFARWVRVALHRERDVLVIGTHELVEEDEAVFDPDGPIDPETGPDMDPGTDDPTDPGGRGADALAR